MHWTHFIVVGLGAAVGAWGRWLLGLVLNPLWAGMPLGTFAANCIGGLLVGMAVGVFHLHTQLPAELKLFAITGLLGGLTTFSSFSAEVVERLLAGQWPVAVGMALAHVFASLSLTWLGLYLVGAHRLWS